jgi:lysozyme family protein
VTSFDSVFLIIIGIESGYVNDPLDPGSETNYGISKRRYPNEDIPNMTLERAKFLYQRDYWIPHHCDTLPWCEALLMFDSVVNGGNAEHWHQMYKGSADFIIDYQAEHVLYLASLPNWPHDGRGWLRRAFKIAKLAEKPV